MGEDNDLATYNGSKEVAGYFRRRANVMIAALTKGIEAGVIEGGACGMEKLTPNEYLARCMWAASENVPTTPNAEITGG